MIVPTALGRFQRPTILALCARGSEHRMILKELYLYPDLVEYPSGVTDIFRDQTRCLCNYLERTALKSIRFNSEGFKRICVIGSATPNDIVTINSCNVACINTNFDPEVYKSNSKVELQEYFISMLCNGLNNLSQQVSIPIQEIESGIESFRKAGYKNEWIHKSKKLKGSKLLVSLKCELTVDDFILRLCVTKQEEIIFVEEILKTAPDEIVFVSKFKDIICNEGVCQVSDKFGEIIYERNISDFTEIA